MPRRTMVAEDRRDDIRRCLRRPPVIFPGTMKAPDNRGVVVVLLGVGRGDVECGGDHDGDGRP